MRRARRGVSIAATDTRESYLGFCSKRQSTRLPVAYRRARDRERWRWRWVPRLAIPARTRKYVLGIGSWAGQFWKDRNGSAGGGAAFPNYKNPRPCVGGTFLITKPMITHVGATFLITKMPFTIVGGIFLIRKTMITIVAASFVIRKTTFTHVGGTFLIRKMAPTFVFASNLIISRRFPPVSAISPRRRVADSSGSAPNQRCSAPSTVVLVHF